MVRKSLSLSDSMARDLEYIAKRLGVSQSAVVQKLYEPPTRDFADLLRDTPDQPDEETVRRLRGRSDQLIEKRLDDHYPRWRGLGQ